MKKLFLLAMAFVAVTALAGCSKDDDAPEINPELIVGKWQYVRTAGYYIENGVREEFDNDLTAKNIIIIYKADGSAVNTQHGNEYPFIYKIEGNIYSDMEANTSWEERTIIKLTQTEFQTHEEDNSGASTDYYIRRF